MMMINFILYTMLKIENKLNSLQLFYIFAVKELLRACLHGGGGSQVGEVTRLSIQSLMLI